MAALKLFGRIDGNPVYLIKLTNGSIEAELISYGATLRALRVPDKNGEMKDICLGYESLEEYIANDGYLGATVGRHANRVGGSHFVLGGKEYRLTANEGENQLHGGIVGFSHRLWNFSCTENSVTFSIDSPDGEEGYPGDLHAEVRFSIDGSTLRLDYSAKSNADTVVNLTNHAYFNLGGQESGNIYSHSIKLNAEAYTPCTKDMLPTGEIVPVAGTLMDLREETVLRDRLIPLSASFTEGYDHNFVLSSPLASELYCPETGITMSCRTSLEGMQVYSAGFLGERKGKAGAVYGKHHALCLETQHFPDAVNHSNFPSPVLKAGEEYKEWTEYSFGLR